ncbi:MAG: hypothetical protein IKW79_04075 [Schwartzia sp.]|nr:hypothetical protein [Schwartzia sp. (in: firmicutes)]
MDENIKDISQKGENGQGLAPRRNLIQIYDRDPNHPYNRKMALAGKDWEVAQTSGPSSSAPPSGNPPDPIETNKPVQVSMQGQPPWGYLSVGDIGAAGFSVQQARHLNTLCIERGIDVAYRRLIYQATLDFLKCKRILDNESVCAVDANGRTLLPPSQIDYRAFVPEFVSSRWLCKTRSTTNRTGWRYLIYDSESRRHVAIDTKELRFEFETFLYELARDGDMPTQTFRDQLFEMVLRAVPLVEKSGLRILSASEIPFANGIYDITTDRFTAFARDDAYFSMFAMLFNFDPDAPNPDGFDALLSDSFQGNTNLIQLAYEIIGALIAPGPTLKKIYVFQGVSGGGKTRLAEIVMRLLDEVDITACNTVADIVDENLVKDARDCRLVYIKEVTKNKLSGKQISYLKSFADGGKSRYATAFKMLMCTNYKIVTGDNNFLEPALANRFAVLPFPQPMENTADHVKNFEEMHFEQEKQGIALKALRTFRNVINNGGRFSLEFPVNQIVEKQEATPDLTADEHARVNKLLMEPCVQPSSDRFDALVECLFELTKEVNPDIPAECALALLNQVVPGIVVDVTSLGKRLRSHFGEAFLKDRLHGKMCYNLRLRIPSDPAIQP